MRGHFHLIDIFTVTQYFIPVTLARCMKMETRGCWKRHSFYWKLIPSEQRWHFNSSHNTALNVGPLHSIWLIVFELYLLHKCCCCRGRNERSDGWGMDWCWMGGWQKKEDGEGEGLVQRTIASASILISSRKKVVRTVARSLLTKMPTQVNTVTNINCL